MFNFILGIVFGIVLATVGFQGVASMADKGLTASKAAIQEQAKPAVEVK